MQITCQRLYSLFARERRIIRFAGFGGPVSVTTVGQRVMQRAVARLGEAEVLAQLKISKTSLQAYLSGYSPVKDELLLRAIDLALGEKEADPESSKRR